MNGRICLLAFLLNLTSFVAIAQEEMAKDSVATEVKVLDEIEVKAALVKHDSRSDEYRMTPNLVQGATSAYDVLSRLPGVSYNNVSNAISVRMDQNVMLEVNGTMVPRDYIQALPLDRIAGIQVVYAPSARYTTEGIRYVINIKLKSEYAGHDLYLGNYDMISAGGNNGADIIANEQPRAQYIYSSDKVDLTAGYGFGAIRWNYPMSYSREYTGLASTTTAEVSAKSPNDHNATNSHAANLGLNWHITPYQTLSLQSTFQVDDTKHKSTYDVTNVGAAGSRYTEQLRETSVARNATTALYYQGMFESGWSVYAAAGYDRVRDNIDAEYRVIDLTSDNGKYSNVKDYLRADLDLNYTLTDALSLNFGYRVVGNRYLSYEREGHIQIAETQDERHNGYLFLDWMPREDFMLHVGSGVEAINKTADFEAWRYRPEILPQLIATWQPSVNAQFMAEYSAKMEYPTLYQVGMTPISLDQWLVQKGNPQLHPSRRQSVSLQGSFFESLIVGAEYSHSNQYITDWYSSLWNQSVVKSFTNARSNEFKAVAAYDWAITQDLTWSNTIQWQRQHIAGHGLSRQACNFFWHSSMEYWVDPIGLLAKVEYLRNSQEIPLLQGWQQYGQDLWQMSLRKHFWNKSLSISLNYVPPIHWGIRQNQESAIHTPFFNSRQTLNLNTYDNLLLFRIEWRFNKGRSKQRRVQQYEFAPEQKTDKGLL